MIASVDVAQRVAAPMRRIQVGPPSRWSVIQQSLRRQYADGGVTGYDMIAREPAAIGAAACASVVETSGSRGFALRRRGNSHP